MLGRLSFKPVVLTRIQDALTQEQATAAEPLKQAAAASASPAPLRKGPSASSLGEVAYREGEPVSQPAADLTGDGDRESMVYDKNGDERIDARMQEIQGRTRLQLAVPTGARFHAFISHDWGVDEHGRSNHDRARRANEGLKALGLRTVAIPSLVSWLHLIPGNELFLENLTNCGICVQNVLIF